MYYTHSVDLYFLRDRFNMQINRRPQREHGDKEQTTDGQEAVARLIFREWRRVEGGVLIPPFLSTKHSSTIFRSPSGGCLCSDPSNTQEYPPPEYVTSVGFRGCRLLGQVLTYKKSCRNFFYQRVFKSKLLQAAKAQCHIKVIFVNILNLLKFIILEMKIPTYDKKH